MSYYRILKYHRDVLQYIGIDSLDVIESIFRASPDLMAKTPAPWDISYLHLAIYRAMHRDCEEGERIVRFLLPHAGEMIKFLPVKSEFAGLSVLDLAMPNKTIIALLLRAGATPTPSFWHQWQLYRLRSVATYMACKRKNVPRDLIRLLVCYVWDTLVLPSLDAKRK